MHIFLRYDKKTTSISVKPLDQRIQMYFEKGQLDYVLQNYLQDCIYGRQKGFLCTAQNKERFIAFKVNVSKSSFALSKDKNLIMCSLGNIYIKRSKVFNYKN